MAISSAAWPLILNKQRQWERLRWWQRGVKCWASLQKGREVENVGISCGCVVVIRSDPTQTLDQTYSLISLISTISHHLGVMDPDTHLGDGHPSFCTTPWSEEL